MKSNLCDAVEKVLIPKSEIDKRIEELGKEITEEYRGKGELIVVGILRGAAMFMSNLTLNIDLEVGIDFMAVSSYGHSSESSGTVRIIKDLEDDIAGKNILIVEDIVDSGRTLSYLVRNLMDRKAKSVKIASLLDKPERRTNEVDVQFKGFTVPNEFIVGYGLDFAQQFRNIEDICVLKKSFYEKTNYMKSSRK